MDWLADHLAPAAAAISSGAVGAAVIDDDLVDQITRYLADHPADGRFLVRTPDHHADSTSPLRRSTGPRAVGELLLDRVKSSKFQPLAPLDDRGPISTAIRGEISNNPDTLGSSDRHQLYPLLCIP